MILDCITIILSQFAFIFFRTLNVKFIADNSLVGAMITGLFINILWITTTAFGIKAYESGEWIQAAAYLFGGQLGVLYGMKKNQISNFFNSVYNRFFSTTHNQ